MTRSRRPTSRCSAPRPKKRPTPFGESATATVESARAWQMVRYADGSWSAGPEFQTDGGEPLKGFEPARSSGEAEEVALYAVPSSAPVQE